MRGRPSGERLQPGDVVDFYRVEALEPGRLLRLRAELKAPGEGWMEWQAARRTPGSCVITQTAYFAPRGASGFLYWYLLYPFHQFVFAGLIRALARLPLVQPDEAGEELLVPEKD